MEPTFLALGRALRAFRREKDLSQEDLADAAGVHRTYVGGIERGERNPTYANLLKLTGALEISMSDLMSRVESDETNSRS